MHQYRITILDGGEYLIEPIGNAPPLHAGKCAIGFVEAILSPVLGMAGQQPNRWHINLVPPTVPPLVSSTHTIIQN
jgi:hypothetical protein